MADKHKNLQRRSFIRLSVVGGLALFFIAMSVIGLTRNSQGAKDRYDALIAVDQAGGDVEAALFELQSYIYGHMNTQIGGENGIKPPIQLAGTYGRLVDAEQAKFEQSDVYADAQSDCELRNPTGFSGSNRLDCIEEYVDANGAEEPVVIQDALYKFDFAPPTWSPDFAGFSIVLSVIFVITFLIDLALYFRTRHMVHMAS